MVFADEPAGISTAGLAPNPSVPASGRFRKSNHTGKEFGFSTLHGEFRAEFPSPQRGIIRLPPSVSSRRIPLSSGLNRIQ